MVNQLICERITITRETGSQALRVKAHSGEWSMLKPTKFGIWLKEEERKRKFK